MVNKLNTSDSVRGLGDHAAAVARSRLGGGVPLRRMTMTLQSWWPSAVLMLCPAMLAAQVTVPPELEHLQTPQLTERPPESMLVVEAGGDPRVVGGTAFGLLFQLYYQMPETVKGPAQPAPRARWPVALAQPRSEWIGHYALPVPETVRALPAHTAPDGVRASLTIWEYGTVVEVLHIGPYEREAPTVQRLRDFVEARGYVLATEHEEEYIQGPTMTGPRDPTQYLTILRYRVTKVLR